MLLINSSVVALGNGLYAVHRSSRGQCLAASLYASALSSSRIGCLLYGMFIVQMMHQQFEIRHAIESIMQILFTDGLAIAFRAKS